MLVIDFAIYILSTLQSQVKVNAKGEFIEVIYNFILYIIIIIIMILKDYKLAIRWLLNYFMVAKFKVAMKFIAFIN